MFALKSACSFFFVTTVMWNHLRGFQLCYIDRCLNDLLLLSISCSAEPASKIKDQLPPNSDRLFRNDAGICFTTTVLFFSLRARQKASAKHRCRSPQNLLWFFSLELYSQANYTASLISINVWWSSSPLFPVDSASPPFRKEGFISILLLLLLKCSRFGHWRKKCSLTVYSVAGTEWGSVCDSVFEDK